MRSVYVFCADGFEEVEGLTAVDLLRRAGIDVKMVSIMGRLQITGSHNISVNTDILIEDIKEEADMLLLPGGMPGTNYLRKHETGIYMAFQIKQKANTHPHALPVFFFTINIP